MAQLAAVTMCRSLPIMHQEFLNHLSATAQWREGHCKEFAPLAVSTVVEERGAPYI